MILGTGVSDGIVYGKALVIEEELVNIEKRQINDIEIEQKKLQTALKISKGQLLEIRERVLKEFGRDKADIFQAHMMILEDPELIDNVNSKIKEKKINVEWALKETADQFIIMFESMDNEYIRERISDIKDVFNRIIKNILGQKIFDLSNIDDKVILVAKDLTPSDTATMNKENVLGFVTNIGGGTSHTAIMARSLEIPAIVGLRDITKRVKTGDFLILDGESGKVIINPTDEEIKEYELLKAQYDKNKRELKNIIGKESITIDGRKIELAANIGGPDDILGVNENDAEGIGLFRTEFIYMDRDTMPTEEEQFNVYKKVIQSLNPKPVIIRTLDIGGDKQVSYLKIGNEANPFLGYRAIRICLDQQNIFKTQLRALLRASVYGNLKIMFPMISSLEELLEAKSILEEVKISLDKQGISYDHDIKVGIMIEVPSTAVISHVLARHVDFFSIGTNDLIQYTVAVDRMNEKIHHLYSPFNPAVLRLIKMVIDNGHEENIWVGMCGEAAAKKEMIPILLGMGIDELSMSPTDILEVRKLIRSLKYEYVREISEKVLNMSTVKEIEGYMKNIMK